MTLKVKEPTQKTYIIPVTWTLYGEMEIEASCLEEAIQLAYSQPFPEGEYVDYTFRIQEDLLSILNPEE